MQPFPEAARDVPLVDSCDVLVCGGGPAGVAAAIAAARAGATVRLIELHGELGGVWTAGLLSYVLDAGNKEGVLPELVERLERNAGQRVIQHEGYDLPWVRGSFFYDAEIMKLTLEQMCLEAGVQMQLHTHVVAAARDGENRLAVALTESKSGRQAWAAKIFVDATGDGDLAALAGCGFDVGHPKTGATQPMSLMGLLTGIARCEVEPFVSGGSGTGGAPQAALLAELTRAGVSPSYGKPSLFPIRDDLFALMANHEYGVSALDAAQITRATLRARAELHGIVNGLRALGCPWRKLRLAATGAQIGVREGRRIHGRYTVSADDLIAGRKHDDAVCRVTFPVDVHATDDAGGKSYGNAGVQSQPYDIPLRALIARDVDGLLLAGRCISGDFFAHASYRVTGNAVPLGEAAGRLAALAALSGRLPQAVPFDRVGGQADQ